MATRRARTAEPIVEDVPVRYFTVLAQDPSVRGLNNRALTTRVCVPAEALSPGPKGHRVHVVDFDASRDMSYRARQQHIDRDWVERSGPDLESPFFHQQNVYAITMATLGEFEQALGRPVPWGFSPFSHQIKVAPHAFADANAFYSRESESLNFGYFASRGGGTIFTCLSHDVIAHETAHALLDGLRAYYLHPSSYDQAAFHEGFCDVVALLMVLKSRELLEHSFAAVADDNDLIAPEHLDPTTLRRNVLLKLADEMGAELAGVRGHALRQSLQLEPSTKYFERPEFRQPHRRGEILVAAVLGTFLEVWHERLRPLGVNQRQRLTRSVVAEEGSEAAGKLLRSVIRAIDYLPPVDVTFGDFLSAALTADAQINPDDSKYQYRKRLRKRFRAYGIEPVGSLLRGGGWDTPRRSFTLDGTHFEALRACPEGAFRFVWENRASLEIDPEAFTRVTAVRPCWRVGSDGHILRETVVEVVQTLRVWGRELPKIGIGRPAGVKPNDLVTLHGGNTLIFDEFGRLKFNIGTGIRSRRQKSKLECLADSEDTDRTSGKFRGDFALLHRLRGVHRIVPPAERW